MDELSPPPTTQIANPRWLAVFLGIIGALGMTIALLYFLFLVLVGFASVMMEDILLQDDFSYNGAKIWLHLKWSFCSIFIFFFMVGLSTIIPERDEVDHEGKWWEEE